MKLAAATQVLPHSQVTPFWGSYRHVYDSDLTYLNWPGFSSDRFSCQPVGDRSVSVSA